MKSKSEPDFKVQCETECKHQTLRNHAKQMCLLKTLHALMYACLLGLNLILNT